MKSEKEENCNIFSIRNFMMLRTLLLMLVVMILAGCATGSSGHYRNAGDDVFGSVQKMEYPQKSRAITEMIGRLLTDPQFKNLYSTATERAKKRGHRLPTVIICEIEDNTEAGGTDASTAQIRRELKNALRKTGMFAIIDIGERAKMANVVLHEPDAGAKDDNNASYGEYWSGDFLMRGELSKDDVAGRVYFHFLNLWMTDPVTGAEIWGDTVKVSKEY